MRRLRLTLLGGFQVTFGPRRDFILPAKAQALLAYLALRRGQLHPRDKLTSLLWGDASDALARDSLRHLLTTIRKTLPRALVVHHQMYALDPSRVHVDALEFLDAAREGTLASLQQALALYQGDFLEGLTLNESRFEDWLVSERARLRETAVGVLAKLAEHYAAAGTAEDAIDAAVRLLALDPIHEPMHRLLMRLYMEQGRRGAALKQYQICVGELQREVGVEPDDETRRLYRELLRREKPSTSRLSPDTAGLSNDALLVGRLSERERLRVVMERAWSGRGGVVGIVGEAGVGKSRLADVVIDDARERRGRLAVGHAHETEQVLSFGPWLDALRASSLLSDPDVLDALPPTWRRELARLLPELGPARQNPLPAGDDAARLFEAVLRLLTAAARNRPLVIVLEDLHWADDMSVRLLAFLARRLRSSKVAIVFTAREEDVEPESLLARSLGELTMTPHGDLVRLSPLSREEIGELVAALLPPADQDRVAAIEARVWSLSRGNPFVATEVMRTVRDDGSAMVDGAMPPRVRDVIAARLNRVSATAQRLLGVVAVAGRECSLALLRAAGEMSDEDTAAALEELVRRRVLRSDAEHFDFLHDRLRDVAYDGLLAPRRAVLHERVAAALEQVYADRLDDMSDRLATHYAEAGHAATAVDYLIRVAERAGRVYANDDAIRALERALAQLTQLPAADRDRRRPGVAIRLAQSMYFVGRYRDAVDLLLREQERVTRLADDKVTGPYHAALARYYGLLGKRAQAMKHAQLGVDAATRCGDDATLGRALFALSYESLWACRLDDLERHGRRAVELFVRTGDQWWEGTASWILAMSRAMRGDFENALEALSHTREIGDAIADHYLVSSAEWARGFVLASRGDGAAAVDACQRAVGVATDHFNTSRALSVLGLAHVVSGNGRAAVEALERAVGTVEPAGTHQMQCMFLAWLADAHLVAGSVGAARQAADEGLALIAPEVFPFGVAMALRASGRAHRAMGNWVAGERELQRALDEFTAIGAAHEAEVTRAELAIIDLTQVRPYG